MARVNEGYARLVRMSSLVNVPLISISILIAPDISLSVERAREKNVEGVSLEVQVPLIHVSVVWFYL